MACILVVEDDAQLGRMMCRKLKDAGYEVFWSRSASEVFDALSAQDVNLILLDVMLPEIDGLSVLKTLKADNRYTNISVIMLSNISDSQTMEKARSLGAKDYLVKSNIKLDKLVEKIENDYLRKF